MSYALLPEFTHSFNQPLMPEFALYIFNLNFYKICMKFNDQLYKLICSLVIQKQFLKPNLTRAFCFFISYIFLYISFVQDFNL